MATINFYKSDAPYGCFSNFAPWSFVLDGHFWLTAEHYFQAAKFLDEADVAAVRAASTPFLAAQIGRDKKRSLRPDWEAVKDELMLQVLRAKFSQSADLLSVLASTRGARLVEHTANDRYWGDGGDGTGLNRLGLALEEVREALAPEHLPLVVPPWIAHREIERSDLYWRMGAGEDYETAFRRYVASLTPLARHHFESYYGTDENWR